MNKKKDLDDGSLNEKGSKSDKKHHNKPLSKEELESLKKKAEGFDSIWDKYLRGRADLENAQKRWDKEKSDLLKFSSFALSRDLVVIVDELEQALKSMEEHSSDNKAITEGIRLTYNNLFNILKKEGVTAFESKGKKFDPHVHEIVGQKQASDEEEHMILEEIQKGYMIEDKLLRTAKVIIGIRKQPETSNQIPEEIKENSNEEVKGNIEEEKSEE